VIELKADEDIHLPLQGLDYWFRVKWHHEREEFHRFGYFIETNGATRPLAPESPVLLLVAPALHIHPATDTILRYLSPELDWSLIAVDERWREEVKVVFRKRSTSVPPAERWVVSDLLPARYRGWYCLIPEHPRYRAHYPPKR